MRRGSHNNGPRLPLPPSEILARRVSTDSSSGGASPRSQPVRCGRCGRPLRALSSVAAGYGQKCAEIVGVRWRRALRNKGSYDPRQLWLPTINDGVHDVDDATAETVDAVGVYGRRLARPPAPRRVRALAHTPTDADDLPEHRQAALQRDHRCMRFHNEERDYLHEQWHRYYTGQGSL